MLQTLDSVGVNPVSTVITVKWHAPKTHLDRIVRNKRHVIGIMPPNVIQIREHVFVRLEEPEKTAPSHAQSISTDQTVLFNVNAIIEESDARAPMENVNVIPDGLDIDVNCTAPLTPSEQIARNDVNARRVLDAIRSRENAHVLQGFRAQNVIFRVRKDRMAPGANCIVNVSMGNVMRKLEIVHVPMVSMELIAQLLAPKESTETRVNSLVRLAPIFAPDKLENAFAL